MKRKSPKISMDVDSEERYTPEEDFKKRKVGGVNPDVQNFSDVQNFPGQNFGFVDDDDLDEQVSYNFIEEKIIGTYTNVLSFCRPEVFDGKRVMKHYPLNVIFKVK